MRPFDLEAAKQGAKVITREGLPVRIFCYDLKEGVYTILAAIDYGDEEDHHTFTKDGKLSVFSDDTNLDLFMAPEKRYAAIWLDKDGEPTCTLGLYDSVHEMQTALWRIASQPNFKIVEFEV